MRILSTYCRQFMQTTKATRKMMTTFASPAIKPIVPRTDRRTYEALVTSNGVRVLFISDPHTDRCAAAMNAGVGSFNERIPGIAHLLEHLLLSNSKKYPKLNSLSKFLDAHGGSYNAMTSHDMTLYFFDIMPEYMNSALDMFLHCFIEPLLPEDAVASETEAVDHEFQKNIGSDSFRMYDFVNSRMSHKHPVSRFSIGNEYTLKTLPAERGERSRDLVVEFYEKEYSSNRMSLALLSNESIEQLKSNVLPLVQRIPNKNLAFSTYSPANPIEGACLGKIYKVEPVSDIHKIAIAFSIPDLIGRHKERTLRHIDYYMEMRHSQSFPNFLQQKGWGTSISMKEPISVRGTNVIDFHLSLSSNGVEHYEEIIGLFFKYIQLLKEEGAQPWRLRQQQQQSQIDFDYRDKSDPSEHVCRLVESMDKVDLEDVECHDILIQKLDIDLYRQVLDYIQPKNAAIFLFSKKFANECTQTELLIEMAIPPLPNKRP